MTIFLYKKTHLVTGLNYLGKTISKDPHKYRGSGKYWLNHIKKHGYLVNTEILKECQTSEELKEWGSYYSELWNVVKSNEWANLRPESGDGGTTSEIQNRLDRIEKNRQSAIDMWANENHKKMRIERMTIGLNQSGVQNKKSKSLKKTLSSLEGKKKNLDSLNIARSSDKWKEKVYDTTLYTFYHHDGRIVQCTRSELINRYQVHKGNLSSVISRKSKYKSVNGWSITPMEYKK